MRRFIDWMLGIPGRMDELTKLRLMFMGALILGALMAATVLVAVWIGVRSMMGGFAVMVPVLVILGCLWYITMEKYPKQ